MDRDSILEAAERMAEQFESDYKSPVEISPVPTVVKMHRETQFVVMTLLTPIGENSYFLDLESAEKMATAIQNMIE